MGDDLRVTGDPTADFRTALSDYTKKAACGRHYVLVSKLRIWLESKVPPGADGRTQTSRLLTFAYRGRSRDKPALPITPEVLSDIHDGCLLVFCILFELGHGDFIDLFYRRNTLDKHLPIPLQLLRDTVMNMPASNPIKLATDFNNLQWRFCPPTFEMNMGRCFLEHQIMPFCKRQKINDKGGTAQLWQIEVPEEFVGPNLVQAIKIDRKYIGSSDDLGPRYNFALKTFDEDNRAIFENEKDAFLALRHHAGMIQYLGNYEHVEVHASTMTTTTSNIILEFGDHDLDEYFMEFAPPVLQIEIKSFWEGLFDVAYAVQGIHHLEVNRDGRTQKFNGWHADIKPDNILIVQGRFKLADPGFATFVEMTETEPKKVVAGGTETYGAPERRYSRSGTSAGAVSQTIDTWSLGCVFSIAATWVVLGPDGIRQFTELRQRSISKIIEEQAQNPTRPRLTPGDYFHNGEEVLADVLDWHIYLRSVSRKSDVITSNVLDLIDKMMLVGDAGRRIKANDLCQRLDDIKSHMQNEDPPIPIGIMEYLLAVDEAPPRPAMASGTEASTTEESTERKKTPTIVDKRQAQKSAFLGAPLKMTARRSEYRKSESSNSHVSIQRDEENPDISFTVPLYQTPVSQNVNEESSLLNQRNPRIQTEDVSAVEVPTTTNRRHTHGGSFSTATQRPASQKQRTNPPQDVFQAREEIESRSKVYLFKRKTAKDELLSRHFNNRDIKFLVDNAESMSSYWYNVKYLLETLLLKATGQDENGMDLSFTSGNISVRNSNDVSKFTKALDDPKAQPRINHMHTDLKRSLGDILYEYFQEARKRGGWSKNLTLIVLTDGKWDGMDDKNGVRTMIIEFANELQKLFGNLKHRPVSIEFIQFGDDPNATSRLRRLDDELVFSGIPDIVDHEHCSGDVNKMLLGSFVEEYDLIDDEQPATLSTILELDAGPLMESPFQQQIDYFPTSSSAETGLFGMPTRSSMGSQAQRNMSTAGLQREPSTRSSMGSQAQRNTATRVVHRNTSTRSARHSHH